MKHPFPGFFPKDCPPPEAEPVVENFFRLVSNDPPDDKDFRSHVEMYPRIRFRNKCAACGLSVFTRLEDIKKLRRRLKALSNKKIAKGKANLKDGPALPTPSVEGDSHHTWWLFQGANVTTSFTVVDENIEASE
jgi:hypothetical protein